MTTMDSSMRTSSFLIGFIAGGIVSLLFTPKKGSEMRTDLKRKADSIKEKYSKEEEQADSQRDTPIII